MAEKLGIMVRIEALHFRYPAGQFALSIPRFEVADNETVAIIGPSGTGKTMAAEVPVWIKPHTVHAAAPEQGCALLGIDEFRHARETAGVEGIAAWSRTSPAADHEDPAALASARGRSEGQSPVGGGARASTGTMAHLVGPLGRHRVGRPQTHLDEDEDPDGDDGGDGCGSHQNWK